MSAAAPTSGWTVHVSGPIVAVKSSTVFQINGGGSVGYIDIALTSSTTKIYNGLTLSVGKNANVYGNKTSSTTITATQVELTSTATTPPPATGTVTTGVPKHVLTAGIFWGYSGTPTSVPVSSAAPYMTWAQTSPAYAGRLRSAGMKVSVYTMWWRNYSSDTPTAGYYDLKPGGAHAAAEVKTCTGAVAHDSTYGGGYEADARSSATVGHANVVLNSVLPAYGGQYDALFSDDTGALYGMPTPCGYTDAGYKTATNAVDTAIGKRMFINTLGAGTSAVGQVGYTTASTVIGAMCESCYAYWTTVSGVKKDFPRTGGAWTDTENAEALMVSRHKIFWDYARAVGTASTSTALRNYIYTSFLLTYDPNYAMLQEAFTTPSKFEVFPETGLVPMSPVTTSTSVASYHRSTGAYMREFGACYYRGVNKGRCAVVVNPSASASVTVPTTAYSHSMVLSGNGVLDGGAVSFAGARPGSLGPAHGVILFP